MYHMKGELGAEFETRWNNLGKRKREAWRKESRDGGGQKAQGWVDDTSVALTPAFSMSFSAT